MKKKLFLAIFTALLLSCLFTLVAFAAEPSASDDFGETTLITDNEAINNKASFGYTSGDTSRVVVKVPGTDTYMTYPAYYVFDDRNDGGNGYQPVLNMSYLANATGLSYDETSVIRLEIPNVFSAVSKTYTHTNVMTSLKSVYFQDNMQIIHAGALQNITSLQSVVFTDNSSADIELNIYGNAFENCTALTTIDFPVQLKSMGERTLAGCTSLTSVELPGTKLGAIPIACFLNCTALATLTIDPNNNITFIGHRAFDNCYALTGTVNFNKVEETGSCAFRYAAKNEGTSLTLKIPAMEKLDDETFLGCTNLDIDFDGQSSLTYIGQKAFQNCASLTNVVIAQGFTLIDDYAFQNCKALATCTFLGNAAKDAVIDQAAFENCWVLRNVYIPEGVTTLGNCAYKGAGVQNLSLPTTLTTLNGNSHFHGSALETVTGLENTKITTIPYSMFRSQSKWAPVAVYLPNTVSSIGQYGMADCGAQKFYLGAGMQSIGVEAFVNCPNVKEFYIPSTVTSISGSAFSNNKTGNILFFVTADKDASVLGTLKSNVGITNDYVSIDTYETSMGSYSSGKYIVYGCNLCDTFYGGTHGESISEKRFEAQAYFTPYKSYSGCQRCKEIVETTLADALFTYKGFSTDGNSIVYDIKINKDAISTYANETGKAIKYGIVASQIYNDGNLLDNKGNVVNDCVVAAEFSDKDYSFLRIKILNVAENLKTTPIHCCAYIIEENTVKYLYDTKDAEGKPVPNAFDVANQVTYAQANGQ